MRVMKKSILILLSISIFITNLPLAEAKATMDYNDQKITIIPDSGGGGGGGGSSNTCDPSGRVKCFDYNQNGIERSYKIQLTSYIKAQDTTTISVYDMKDNDIIKADATISPSDLPLAGTAVGLNIHESKMVYTYIKSIDVLIYNQKETVIEYDNTYKCTFRTNVATWITPEIFDGILGLRLPIVKPDPNKVCLRKEELTNKNTCSGILDPQKYPNDKYCILSSGPVLVERTPKEVIYDRPNRNFTINLTSDEGGELKTLKTSFTKSEFNLDDIDWYVLVESMDESSNNGIERAVQHFIVGAAQTNKNYTNGSWQASYDISLSNSNDVNDPNGIRITQASANATAVFYDMNNNKIECARSKCTWDNTYGWKYTPGHYNGDTYYFGKLTAANTLYDIRYIEMEYRTGKTCMDPKTGNVRYLSSGTDNCKQTEYTIQNTTIGDEIHWHYFIPLNTKSGNENGILVQMHPAISNSGLNGNTCLNVLRTNYITKEESGEPLSGKTPYTNVIKPKNSEMFFVGDYYCVENCGTPDAVFNENSKDFKSIVDNSGCYKRSVISIPIKQSFYGEISGTKLQGFNFYYQPIDVYKEEQTSSIFPNGSKTQSLWNDWYNAQKDSTATDEKKQPDLSKSFEEVTYAAQNISVVKVRNYKEEETDGVKNLYTSWQNMNIDGTSKFIGNELDIVSRVNPTENYKLGCGPLNEKEFLEDGYGNILLDANRNKIKNILYVKECAA